MNVLDLTHTITEATPLWPGTPAVQLEPLAEYGTEGYRETMLHFSSHTGTHIDAPAHLLRGGLTLDSFPPKQFAGTAVTLDCRNRSAITLSMLHSYETALSGAEFVLFDTGWSRYWQTPDYFGAYPALEPQAAQYLAGMRLKGIGSDTVSLDPFMDDTLAVHRILLGAGLLLLENLCNLSALTGRECFLTAAPLKIGCADGAPARVLAITSF